MNRDAKGRFTTKSNTMFVDSAGNKLANLENKVKVLDLQLKELEAQAQAESPGDTDNFRKFLIKQKEQIDVMLEALDLLDKVKEQRAPKKKGCKCGSCKKVKDIPDTVMELLEPILEELNINLDDVEKIGVIKVKADSEDLEDIPELDELPLGDMSKTYIKELLGKKFPVKPKGRKKK